MKVYAAKKEMIYLNGTSEVSVLECFFTEQLWWLLLAVNSVNQRQHILKVYAAEKETIYLNGTSKVSILEHFFYRTPMVAASGSKHCKPMKTYTESLCYRKRNDSPEQDF